MGLVPGANAAPHPCRYQPCAAPPPPSAPPHASPPAAADPRRPVLSPRRGAGPAPGSQTAAAAPAPADTRPAAPCQVLPGRNRCRTARPAGGQERREVSRQGGREAGAARPPPTHHVQVAAAGDGREGCSDRVGWVVRCCWAVSARLTASACGLHGGHGSLSPAIDHARSPPAPPPQGPSPSHGPSRKWQRLGRQASSGKRCCCG